MKRFKISQSITDRQDASLGLYFKDVSKQPMIDAEEETRLAKEARNGNVSAINKLVKANLRFVISVAKQYQNNGLALVDLIQEGNLGLAEAAKKFDETKGFRFISYAVWWIRQAIIRAISEQCRTVRIPMNQVAYLSKINKASEKFEQINGRKPSSIELEEYTNIDSDKINLALTASTRAISLDSPFKDEDVGCLLDVIPGPGELADENISRNDLSNGIEYILSRLPNRDRDILKMSFGIGMQPMPNEEIASRFGIGSERVRQIQHNAIDYIRKYYSSDLKKLL